MRATSTIKIFYASLLFFPLLFWLTTLVDLHEAERLFPKHLDCHRHFAELPGVE